MPVELGMGHKKAVKRTIFTRIQVHRAHMLGFQVQSAAERANLYIGKQAIKNRRGIPLLFFMNMERGRTEIRPYRRSPAH